MWDSFMPLNDIAIDLNISANSIVKVRKLDMMPSRADSECVVLRVIASELLAEPAPTAKRAKSSKGNGSSSEASESEMEEDLDEDLDEVEAIEGDFVSEVDSIGDDELEEQGAAKLEEGQGLWRHRCASNR